MAKSLIWATEIKKTLFSLFCWDQKCTLSLSPFPATTSLYNVKGFSCDFFVNFIVKIPCSYLLMHKYNAFSLYFFQCNFNTAMHFSTPHLTSNYSMIFVPVNLSKYPACIIISHFITFIFFRRISYLYFNANPSPNPSKGHKPNDK